jgi:hypothetical protein
MQASNVISPAASETSESSDYDLMVLANYRKGPNVRKPIDPATPTLRVAKKHKPVVVVAETATSAVAESELVRRVPRPKVPTRIETLGLTLVHDAHVSAAVRHQSTWIRKTARKVCLYGDDCYKAGLVAHEKEFTHSRICDFEDVWTCTGLNCENSHHLRVRSLCSFNTRCTNEDCQYLHTTICPLRDNCPFFKAGHSCVNLHVPPFMLLPPPNVADRKEFPAVAPPPAVPAWNKPLKIRVPEPTDEERAKELEEKLEEKLCSSCLTSPVETLVQELTKLRIRVPKPVDVAMSAEEEELERRRCSSCLSSPVVPRVQQAAPVPVPVSVPRAQQAAPVPAAVPQPTTIVFEPPAPAPPAAGSQFPPVGAPPGMVWVYDLRMGWYLFRF